MKLLEQTVGHIKSDVSKRGEDADSQLKTNDNKHEYMINQVS